MSLLAATALLAVLAPAVAAVAGLPLGRRSRRAAVGCGVAGAAVALLAAVAEVAVSAGGTVTDGVGLLGRADTGTVAISLVLRADALAGLVAVATAGVALAVQVYSAAYLHGAGTPEAPTRYPAYAATVSLFTSAMMLVVHGDDLVLVLVGWEAMGLCSYLLIGHHSEREPARRAAVKAFLVTRVGDVAFLLGVVALLAATGTSSVTGLLALAAAGEVPASTATLGSLLLTVGVLGKSAQFPLHTWLPDAMEGPTPVSALIHAATMVAAGVYLVARLHPLFLLAPATLVLLAVVTSVTMLGAALAALAQSDLKRLLAWSTVSQVALMLAALAVGGAAAGPAAGILHLLSHAGFKALLFLAAGCVAHLTGTTVLARLGGLRSTSPLVAVLLAVGLAALAGLPPTGGFWSKDAVLSAAEHTALHPGEGPVPGWAGWLVLVCGALTTLVTAAYAARAFALVVLGPAAPPLATAPAAGGSGGGAGAAAVAHAAVAHAAVPRAMTVPLVVLAVPAALIGLVLLDPPAVLAGAEVSALTATVATLLALAGTAAGLAAARTATRDVADLLPAGGRSLLAAGYRLDAVQDALVVRPVSGLARGVWAADAGVVDAAVRGSAATAGRAGWTLRRASTGVVTDYLTLLVVGAVVAGVAGVALS